MKNLTFFQGDFTPALEKQFLQEIQGNPASPGRPIWVLAATGPLQKRLRQRIAMQQGAMGIRFWSFDSLTLTIAREQLTGKHLTALPVGAELLLMQQVLKQEAPGYFQPSYQEPGFAAALLATLRDLKDAGISPTQLLAHAKTKKLHTLAQYYQAYEQLLREKKFYDSSDLLLAAIQTLTEKRFVFPEQLRFVIYGIYDFTGLQRQFLEQLIQQDFPLQVYFPREHEFSKPAAIFFRQFAVAQKQLSNPAQQRKTNCYSTVGEEEELRELMRGILQLYAQGFAWHEMAVVARNTAPYHAMLSESFAAQHIPLTAAKPTSLAQNALGKALLIALSLDPQQPSRRAVITFLSLALVDARAATGIEEPSISDWDLLLRQAGIVQFADTWQSQLRKATPPQYHSLAQQAIAGLEHFFSRWRKLRDTDETAKISQALENFVQQIFVASPAKELFLEACQQLTRLHTIQTTLANEERLQILKQLLEKTRLPEDVPGVFWGDPLALRGLSFRAVFLLGMNEKVFPRFVTQDPILLDSERYQLTQALPQTWLYAKARAHIEEPYLFHLLQNASEEYLVFSRSRLDPVTGHENIASRFLHDLQTKETRLPLRFWSRQDQAKPVDIMEFDLRTLAAMNAQQASLAAAYLRHTHPATMSAGIELEAKRWETARLNAYSGAIGATLAQTNPRLSFTQGVAATHLETMARCPFQFFMRYGLQLQPIADPEAEETANINAGILAHAILHVFFKNLPAGGKLASFSFNELTSLLRESIDTTLRSNLDKMPHTWAEQEALRVRLSKLLTAYIQQQHAQDASIPQYVEWSLPENIRYNTGKQRIQLKGRVDRIDMHNQQGKVIDYKFSKSKSAKENLQGGQRIQVSLYAHAVQQALHLREVQGEYHYLADGKQIVMTQLGEVAQVQSLVGALLNLGQQGLFLQIPQACDYCDYSLICAGEQRGVFQLKKADKNLQEFLNLRLPEDELT